MDYYKVLGIDENATKEEIQKAYDLQVKKYKEEVADEKRAEQFLNLFKEAYDELMEKKKYEEMFKEEDTFEESKIDNFHENEENNDLDYTSSSYDNDYLKDDMDYYEEDYDNENYDDEECYNDEPTRKNKKNKRKSKRNKKKRSNNIRKDKKAKYDNSHDNNYDDKENREEKYNKRRNKSKEEREEYASFSFIKLPFKILALPLIILLSIIIFILKIISIATWIVSKVIIIGAIGVASIHAYQIYIGQPRDYRIFAVCIAGFVLAIILPFIIKVFPKPLEGLNNSLKDFVMDR